jgi:hypothetical protein
MDVTQLTGWGVSPGGSHLSLGFLTKDGASRRVVLPLDAVTGLMMTLPRMLQAALQARFPDGSLRAVQPLDTWRLEQAATPDGLILTLRAPGGFEVAFAMDADDADTLATALLRPRGEREAELTRRPN